MVGNLKSQPSILVTVDEVVTLCRKYGTSETADFCYEVAKEWNKRSHQPDSLFSQMCMLSCCFDAGRIQGIREERTTRRRSTPEARRWDSNETPAERERRSAAVRQRVDLTGYAPIHDVDSAAIVYNAARAADPSEPFEFLLGRIYSAGKMDGQRSERERRKKAKTK